MGTQKKIAEKIVKKQGNYIISLKGNQTKFYEEVKEYFEDVIENNFRDIGCRPKTILEKWHGRIKKENIPKQMI